MEGGAAAQHIWGLLGEIFATRQCREVCAGRGVENGRNGLESVKKTDQVARVGMGTRFAARPLLSITGDNNPASI